MSDRQRRDGFGYALAALVAAVAVPLTVWALATGRGATPAAETAREAEVEVLAERAEKPVSAPQPTRVPDVSDTRAEAPAYSEPVPRSALEPEPRWEPEPRLVVGVLPAGSRLDVVLQESLSSATAAAGDRFAMQLKETVTLGSGIVLPAGTTVYGRVQAIERARRPQKPGRLELTSEEIVLESGTYPLDAVLSAGGDEIKGRGSHEEDATRIGIGAAAGTVLGAILEGKEGAVAGLILGGGGVFLATRGEDVELGVGTELVAELERDLRVEAHR